MPKKTRVEWKKWCLWKLQKYSYINNRSHYIPNCTRKEAGCIKCNYHKRRL